MPVQTTSGTSLPAHSIEWIEWNAWKLGRRKSIIVTLGFRARVALSLRSLAWSGAAPLLKTDPFLIYSKEKINSVLICLSLSVTDLSKCVSRNSCVETFAFILLSLITLVFISSLIYLSLIQQLRILSLSR